MKYFIHKITAFNCTEFVAAEGLALLDKQILSNDNPDSSYYIGNEENQIEAHASCWWTNVPDLAGHKVCLIGHYAALSDNAADLLIESIIKEVKEINCTICIAPMNGNTWKSYRFVTEYYDVPAFFLEPFTPKSWYQHFANHSFTMLAHYSSSIVTDLSVRDTRVPLIEKRLTEIGVIFRPLDMDRFEAELNSIYHLSLVAFKNNFLYSEISFDQFLSLYLPLKKLIVPEHTILAEQNHKLIGYIFAVPDLYQTTDCRTLIIKSIAVNPERQYAGLGAVLADQLHHMACEKQFKQVIHALMHDTNKSLNLSKHYATPMRGYSLLAKKII